MKPRLDYAQISVVLFVLSGVKVIAAYQTGQVAPYQVDKSLLHPPSMDVAEVRWPRHGSKGIYARWWTTLRNYTDGHRLRDLAACSLALMVGAGVILATCRATQKGTMSPMRGRVNAWMVVAILVVLAAVMLRPGFRMGVYDTPISIPVPMDVEY